MNFVGEFVGDLIGQGIGSLTEVWGDILGDSLGDKTTNLIFGYLEDKLHDLGNGVVQGVERAANKLWDTITGKRKGGILRDGPPTKRRKTAKIDDISRSWKGNNLPTKEVKRALGEISVVYGRGDSGPVVCKPLFSRNRKRRIVAY
jgi:hypothetical protein